MQIFQILHLIQTDTDKSPEIVESFNGLNLDPDSRNYVVRRIGTSIYEQLIPKVKY